jgi:hypothetical protein
MTSQTSVKPDPDYESFALDCIQRARQEKSLQLRSRLLVMAREWMHAAMQEFALTKWTIAAGRCCVQRPRGV